MLHRLAVCIICTVIAIVPARAEEALLAVAANFAEVVQELKPLFERASGHRLQSTTGSTGKLYAQIKEGAPFHILLSADAAIPERMETEKTAVAGSRFTYAIGKLALWSADPERIGSDGVAALKASDVRHIAIANPDLAPYGVAARETLQSLGLWDLLKSKIVMGQNIGQTHSMVATGNAQLGFVALSAVVGARESAKGSRWDVPQSHFTPIRQDAVLLGAGAKNAAAIAFLAFLRTPQARAVVDRYGYGIE
jgi:molybdate transport system substrate-binding protein